MIPRFFIFVISPKLLEIVKLTEIRFTSKIVKKWKFYTDHNLNVLIIPKNNKFFKIRIPEGFIRSPMHIFFLVKFSLSGPNFEIYDNFLTIWKIDKINFLDKNFPKYNNFRPFTKHILKKIVFIVHWIFKINCQTQVIFYGSHGIQ